MNRRGFMKAILAAGVAPYVCTASGVLMPVRAVAVPELWTFGGSTIEFWHDGFMDDIAAWKALMDNYRNNINAAMLIKL